jgi:monoamine oxidase
MTHDTIIIGAGPAGLYAAYLLAKQGRRCLVLEARARIGGRARSIRTEHAMMIETGAEFVHGKLPLSLGLLDEARLPYTVISGNWVSIKGGMAAPDSEGPQWKSFMDTLGALDADMTLQAFLDTHFLDHKYAALRDRAIAFAEGYDSADAARVSVKALFEEWSAEESEQYRIDDGYSALMDYLAVQVRAAGSRIWVDKEVTKIDATERSISVSTADEEFSATQVIVAVPLGVLQSGRLEIVPGAEALQQTFARMGFGDVIKFVLVFRDAFWETHFPGLGFLMSGADVPTWWTQSPKKSNVFTGWLAGRTAKIRSGLSTGMLRQMALDSLAILFSKPVEVLEAELLELHVFNWSGDPLTGGAYAYETPEAADARESLRKLAPAGLSFIGEYEYAGPSMGTVEAAFRSAASLLSPSDFPI